ncbi:MAG: hypothetical protein ACREF7_01280 [Candidatus Saccharimonadales bacterium]
MPNFEQDYIPYETTARHIVASDESHRLFIETMFPEATDMQRDCFLEYLIGVLHDGIMTGLDMVEGADPITALSAYQLGVDDGLAKRDD